MFCPVASHQVGGRVSPGGVGSLLACLSAFVGRQQCMCCAALCHAEGAIDEAMAEVLDEDYTGGGMMHGGGGAFVV